ncbi:MAG: substrate-binding domain-containing protein [Cyclobacteriaceae bacterium]
MGVFLPASKDTNDYWHYPITGIDRAIDEISDHGINVKHYFFDLNSIRDFESKGAEVLKDKPNFLITAPIFDDIQTELFKGFDSLNIKYVLIDSDVSGSSRISYVGQHTERSGRVAGRLMQSLIPREAGILTVNILSGSDITPVIQKRIEGFKKYIQEEMPESQVEEMIIQLPDESMSGLVEVIQKGNIKGLFVPGSKSHLIAQFLQDNNINGVKIVGYDLIEGNIACLKNDSISYLISQRPAKQGYHGIMSLFNYLVKKETDQNNILLPIDIILKENVDDYISSIQL